MTRRPFVVSFESYLPRFPADHDHGVFARRVRAARGAPARAPRRTSAASPASRTRSTRGGSSGSRRAARATAPRSRRRCACATRPCRCAGRAEARLGRAQAAVHRLRLHAQGRPGAAARARAAARGRHARHDDGRLGPQLGARRTTSARARPRSSSASMQRISAPGVTHLGNVPNARVLELMEEADYFVLPTFHDTFGYVTLEAAGGRRRPSIATDTCALPEIVEHGRNGYLIPFENDPDVGRWPWISRRRDPHYDEAYEAETERMAEQPDGDPHARPTRRARATRSAAPRRSSACAPASIRSRRATSSSSSTSAAGTGSASPRARRRRGRSRGRPRATGPALYGTSPENCALTSENTKSVSSRPDQPASSPPRASRPSSRTITEITKAASASRPSTPSSEPTSSTMLCGYSGAVRRDGRVAAGADADERVREVLGEGVDRLAPEHEARGVAGLVASSGRSRASAAWPRAARARRRRRRRARRPRRSTSARRLATAGLAARHSSTDGSAMTMPITGPREPELMNVIATGASASASSSRRAHRLARARA